MRCNDCQKFVSIEENEPEIENLDIDEEGNVNVSVRIVNSCADCGVELREARFEMEAIADGAKAHLDSVSESDEDNHELQVSEGGSERTNRSEGKGRGTRTYYGFSLEADITCSCGGLEPITIELKDDIQASSMDEC